MQNSELSLRAGLKALLDKIADREEISRRTAENNWDKAFKERSEKMAPVLAALRALTEEFAGDKEIKIHAYDNHPKIEIGKDSYSIFVWVDGSYCVSYDDHYSDELKEKLYDTPEEALEIVLEWLGKYLGQKRTMVKT